MRYFYILPVLLLVGGCAGPDIVEEGEMAPYKTLVIFNWLGNDELRPDYIPPTKNDASGENGTEGGNGDEVSYPKRVRNLSRKSVENEILNGFEEYRVFSDFIESNWKDMERDARSYNADLILLMNVQSIAKWDEDDKRTVIPLGILDGVLWLATGFLSWWVADHEYPTLSYVEVFWKRPEFMGPKGSPRPALAVSTPTILEDIRGSFGIARERITSGKYKLSFWERAKPWKYPLAYILSIVLPPVLTPLKDDSEVDKSLESLALEDIKIELARRLQGRFIGAGGSPFRFRMDQPTNGEAVDADSVTLRFRYSVEAGFKEYKDNLLSRLGIAIKRSNSNRYVWLKQYKDEEIAPINNSIELDQFIEIDIPGLEPGVNLIRFGAEADYDGQWITNTVAIIRK